MGVNNRERRRVKKRKRQQGEAARGVPRQGRRGGSGDPGDAFHSARFDERLVQDAVVKAAEAFRSESKEAFECALDALVVAGAFVGRPAVDAAVRGGWSGPSTERGTRGGNRPT